MRQLLLLFVKYDVKVGGGDEGESINIGVSN